MTTIFLVRHASHTLQARINVGRTGGIRLSAEGRAQAERLADRLSRYRFTAIYASPLERAQDTAGAVARRLGLEIRTEEAANEVDFGQLTNKALDELWRQPQWISRGSTPIPGVETLESVQNRIVGLIDILKDRHRGDGLVIVTHGDVIRTALCYYLGMPLTQFRRLTIDPGSFSILVIEDEQISVSRLNDCSD